MPFRTKLWETDNSLQNICCTLPAVLPASQAFLRSPFGAPRPVQRLQPLDPTAQRLLSVAPQAGLWPEPTRGRTLAATPCGGRYPWPPQKLRCGLSPDKSAPLAVSKG